MPIVSGGGGGGGTPYSPPTTRGLYSGNNVAVPNAQQRSLTWDSLDGGSAILGLTDPSAPTVATAGIYSIAVVVAGSGLTVGGYATVQLELDSNNLDASILEITPSADAANNNPRSPLAMTCYLPAGGIILVKASNSDGVATRNFWVYAAVVQRIT